MNWSENINEAIEYIENNLSDKNNSRPLSKPDNAVTNGRNKVDPETETSCSVAVTFG